MEEKDFERIEQMIVKVVKTEVGKAVQAEVGGIKEDIRAVRTEVGGFRKETAMKFERVDEKFERFRKDINEDFRQARKESRAEINEDFRHHVGILAEDFHSKLQLVAEGHQMLSEKLDRVEERLENKIGAVAADLAAHRLDTEGHKRGYVVSEP